MNLSDLGTPSGGVSASATAPGLPTPGGSLGASALGAVSDPSSAIAQGSNLFDAAYSKAGGSITGTVAVAASIVSDLPAGAAKQMLNQVLGIVSGAAAGAAMGSIVPGWGTAVGAAVGAIMGLVESLTTPTAEPPEGDNRSTSEKYVFPPIQATPSQSDPESLLEQNCAQPATWVNVRTWSTGFSVPYTGLDEATGINSPPATFTFGTAWVSPPGSTATSKAAAWYVAQAWIGQNSVTRAYGLNPAQQAALGNPPGDMAAKAEAIAGARERAGTVLGSDVLTAKAIALVSRWYGEDFGPKASPKSVWAWDNWKRCAGTNTPATSAMLASTIQAANRSGGIGYSINEATNFGDSSPSLKTAQEAALQKAATCLSAQTSLDFTYYVSPNQLLLQQTSGGSAQQVVPSEYFFAAGPTYNASYFVSCPDTIVVGLAELACLVVLGELPSAGADHVALQYTMSLAWLWRRGYEQDTKSGAGVQVRNHPNIVRVIGLLSGRLHATKAAAAKRTGAKAKAVTTAKAAAKAKAVTTAKAAAKAKAANVRRVTESRQTTTLRPALGPAIAAPAGHSWAGDLAKALLVSVAAGAVVTFLRKRR